MSRRYDQAYRAARERRIQEKRRVKMLRRVRIGAALLLLTVMVGLIGYGIWSVVSK